MPGQEVEEEDMVEAGSKASPIAHLFSSLRERGQVVEYSCPGSRDYTSAGPPHLRVWLGRRGDPASWLYALLLEA